MKLNRFILLLSVSVALFSCKKTAEPASPDDQPVTPTSDVPSQKGSEGEEGYTLVWEDLFDDGILNTANWTAERSSTGGGNNELQFYIADNVIFETEPESKRKCVVLVAKKEEYESKECTSGKIHSQGKQIFQECKIEALIKMPKTYKGLWPAFWMLGYDFKKVSWPACGEIDILEAGHYNGMSSEEKSEKYLNGACHWGPKFDKKRSVAKHSEYRYSLQDGFHLFTMKWDKEKIACYIDLDIWPGQLPYFEMDISNMDPDDELAAGKFFHKPYYIIFNLAIGGNFPAIYQIDKITALNEANGYEAKMYIDYVRVYQKN